MKAETKEKIENLMGAWMAVRKEAQGALNDIEGVISAALDETGTVSYPECDVPVEENDVPWLRFRKPFKDPEEGRLYEGVICSVNVYPKDQKIVDIDGNMVKFSEPPTVTVIVMDWGSNEKSEVAFEDIERDSMPAVLEFIDRFAPVR